MYRLIAALVAVISLVAGCASGSSRTADAPGTQLQFTAGTLDGQPFSGESLKGKPAVLWFWAPWCPTCQRDAPLVARVAAANPAVTFVGVGAQDKLPELRAFAAKYRVDKITELADTDAAVWAKFGVTHQPAYAFVSAEGAVDVVRGSLSESELTARVHALTGR